MSVRNLGKLFKPETVALIGATDRVGSVGAVVMRNLRRAGFRGELLMVNPHRDHLEGLTVYPDVEHLPYAPDLAIIATRPDTVSDLIAALGSRGTRAAIVITAGFGELGEAGRAMQQAVLDAARPYLLRVLGPNCIGLMVPGIGLDASFSHLAPPPGDIAFVSQSGAMVTAMLDWAAPRGIGFSHVVSLGNMADVDFGDLLDYLAADPQTRAILLYIEGITHSRKFMSAARAAARDKPVLALKAGRSLAGARAAASHTGMLAGVDAVYDAALARAGILRVERVAELFEAAETLSLTHEQRDERLAIVTNGGGAGVLATDALAASRGTLATLTPETIAALDRVLPSTWSRGNPIDIIGDASGERYRAALEAVANDRNVDALIVLNCPTALASSEDAARAVIDAVQSSPQLRRWNVFTAWLGAESATAARRLFDAAHIPTYDTPDEAVTAFLYRVRHHRARVQLLETPAARTDRLEPDRSRVRQILSAVLSANREWLYSEEVSAVLAAYHIPQPAARPAADPKEAAAVAAVIGFPVALKIRSPDITHKSDIGGVALDLPDGAAVEAAATTMLARARQAQPEARIEGVLVQQMIRPPDAIELLLGLNDDPVFGPVVAFGQGGIAVELLQDSALALPPLNSLLAREQMARTRIWRLLQGYRGRPPADINAITDVLIRVAQLATDHAEIRELDINPLLADADGVVALDARIRIAAAPTGTTRLAIAPYPDHLESDTRLRDGTTVHLRPIRPEDEPLLHDLVAHMSMADLRLRFFSPIRALSHAAAARLTQIDYDREMAILALHDGILLGVARFFADPDRLQAEYAIAVRTDWQQHGVGYLLMTYLIDVARQYGIGEIYGLVLTENTGMLEMCSALDFTIASDPDDLSVSRVRKSLTA
jgi:acetyltransferase